MATLPDLPISEIGIMGFWNSTANGHDYSNENFAGFLQNDLIESYTLYDNGVEGKIRWGERARFYSNSYRDVTPKEYGFRFKADGWFIVWVPRTQDFSTDSNIYIEDDYLSDPAEIEAETNWKDAADWKCFANIFEFPLWYTTTFPRTAVHGVLSDVLTAHPSSNINGNDIQPEEIGYHCPAHPTASNMTHFNAGEIQDSSVGQSGISYPSQITRHHHSMYLAAHAIRERQAPTMEFPVGNVLLDIQRTTLDTLQQEGRYFVWRSRPVDVLDEGLMPNAGTMYRHILQPASYQYGLAHHLLVWS